MSIDQPTTGRLRYAGRPGSVSAGDTTNLADLLERILDKGIVIAGDISISLIDVELLTIKLRLLVASVDKAREIGVSWWEHDPWLSGRAENQNMTNGEATPELSERSGGQDSERHTELMDRLERLENAVAQIAGQGRPSEQPSDAAEQGSSHAR